MFPTPTRNVSSFPRLGDTAPAAGAVVMPNVRVSAEGAIGRITLARPEKKNALDRASAEELAEALFALSESPVRVVAIDGDGPDFCAGADLAALEGMLDAPRQ